MKTTIIAIDGPSGAGKTTTARKLSQRLNFDYCDSGGIYRAICYLALKENIGLNDQEAILRLFEDNDIVVKNGNVSFCGCDITSHLRDRDVSLNVSQVSILPKVREYVTRLIRSCVKGRGIVVEGRDIGSVIFPNTPFKFFLTAELSIRKKRKPEEEIEERDNKDISREIAPLIRPLDSLLIETDNLSEDKVAERIIEKLNFVKKRDYLHFLLGKCLFFIFKLYFRLSIKGIENIPSSGPFIVASNHLSYLDPPIIGVAFRKRRLYYFAKKELFFPIFGFLIKRLNALPVKRGGANKETIRKIIRLLENGGAMLIFPEGTRKKGKPKPGIGFITYLSNKTIRTPIIPIRVIGTDKALGVGEFFIKPRKIKVIIGNPIYPETLDLSNYQKTADMVMDEIRRLKD